MTSIEQKKKPQHVRRSHWIEHLISLHGENVFASGHTHRSQKKAELAIWWYKWWIAKFWWWTLHLPSFWRESQHDSHFCSILGSSEIYSRHQTLLTSVFTSFQETAVDEMVDYVNVLSVLKVFLWGKIKPCQTLMAMQREGHLLFFFNTSRLFASLHGLRQCLPGPLGRRCSAPQSQMLWVRPDLSSLPEEPAQPVVWKTEASNKQQTEEFIFKEYQRQTQWFIEKEYQAKGQWADDHK